MQVKSKKIRFSGIASNDSRDKTVVVKVTSVKKHPKYFKQYTVHNKYIAHDESNQVKKDDRVEIEATTPRSKLKRWVIIRKEK